MVVQTIFFGQAQDLPLHISDINIKGNESEENHSNLDILTTLKKGQKISVSGVQSWINIKAFGLKE